MKYGLSVCLLIPALSVAGMGMAETVVLQGVPASVTVHPEGAKVTRVYSIDLPAGSHELVLPDLPRSSTALRPQVELAGARVRSTALRETSMEPHERLRSPEIETAEARIAALEEELRAAQSEIERTLADAEGHQARVAFLTGLAGSEAVAGQDVASLLAMSEMISSEVRKARQAALEATERAEMLERELEPLHDALEAAEQALEALLTASEDFAQMTVFIDKTEGGAGDMSVSYYVDATWQPAYDISLDRHAGRVQVARDALIWQGSGEDWSLSLIHI